MSKSHPKVSVVVINARGTENLEKCLMSLAKTDYAEAEILVVDCQTSQIEDWIASRFKNVKVIHLARDIGPSASHNVGAEEADPKSKYITFLDNDTVVEPAFLKQLTRVLEEDEKIGIAQAKILKTNEEDLLDHTGLAIDTFGTWKTTFDMKEKYFDRVFEIFAASSAACIVRRKVFNEVGGFDSAFFIYDDDTDFCWRTRLLGYKVIFVPLARVHHSGDIKKGLHPKRLYHSAKNRVCSMLKNYELKNLWQRVFMYYVLLLLCAYLFELMLKPTHAHALLKGLTYPILNLQTIWSKRLMVQTRRRISDSKLFKRKLLRNDVYPTLQDVLNKAVLTIPRNLNRRRRLTANKNQSFSSQSLSRNRQKRIAKR